MRQLLAIHRHGSFVRAADELGISQPALSRSVARLEDQLRARLFERSRSGVVATPLGAALIARVQNLVTASQRLSRDMELVAAGQLGEIRIGLGPSLQGQTARVALSLSGRFPQMRFSLNVEPRRALVADLQNGKLDIVVVSDGEDIDASELAVVPITTERMLAIAAPTHPLATRRKISLDDFAAYPTVSPFKDQVFAALDTQHRRRSYAPPAYITNDASTVLTLVLERGATHIGSEHVLMPWIVSGQVVILDLDWEWTLALNVVMTRAARHSPVVLECATLISQTCAAALDQLLNPHKS